MSLNGKRSCDGMSPTFKRISDPPEATTAAGLTKDNPPTLAPDLNMAHK